MNALILMTYEGSVSNAARYLGMSPAEIVADTKAGAEKVLQLMEEIGKQDE